MSRDQSCMELFVRAIVTLLCLIVAIPVAITYYVYESIVYIINEICPHYKKKDNAIKKSNKLQEEFLNL